MSRARSASRRLRVVLGVTGSIAAYKAAEVARYFMKRGHTVRVVMTDAAEKFISPLTFESLTRQPVTTGFWDETKPGAIGHIELADWADCVVVAPASADLIAKASFGFAESPLLAILLATQAPVVMAPAMNVNMFDHRQTQNNLTRLKGHGVTFVEPESGELACGWQGKGRLSSPAEIYHTTLRACSLGELAGKRVVISAGPTREAIDPVRFISNRSSGKMGIALAREAYRRGADVTFIAGPGIAKSFLPSGVKRISITSALDLREAVFSSVDNGGADIVIMAAAVADFRPDSPSDAKIKKASRPGPISITPNPDILAELGEARGGTASPLLVGFAVETGSVESLIAEASRKVTQKNVDIVVGNLAEDSFDKDTNRVVIVGRKGVVAEIETAAKSTIARGIFDAILALKGQR